MRHHALPRSSTRRLRITLAAVGAASLLALTAACGSAGSDPGTEPSPSGASPSEDAQADLSAGEGTWLLGITSAEGADAETAATTYVAYDPSTGEATARKVPGVQAGSTSPALAALLVSADRAWALPSADVDNRSSSTGRLTVYAVADQSTKTLDMRRLTGQADLEPVAWAFDPNRSETVRVVDSKDRVWAVDLATDRATSEGRLPTQDETYIFTNGFDPNSGVPWVESIDSDETKPAGNGPSDTRPVERDGGTVIASESKQMQELGKTPCGLAGAFTTSDGATWAFCADGDQVTTHVRAEGASEWEEYGEPSSPVAPAASAVTLVLPPAE